MPRPGPRTTYRYTDNFKATAVLMSHVPGVAVQDVADALAIHPFMLSRWRKEAREGRLPMGKKRELDREVAAELKELRALKKDYERLKEEHTLLKKAIAFTSKRKATSSRSSTARKRTTRCD